MRSCGRNRRCGGRVTVSYPQNHINQKPVGASRRLARTHRREVWRPYNMRLLRAKSIAFGAIQLIEQGAILEVAAQVFFEHKRRFVVIIAREAG